MPALAFLINGKKRITIKTQKALTVCDKRSGLFKKLIWQRSTLPHSLPCSTIDAKELNFRVRDGNGCDLFAIATRLKGSDPEL